MKRVLSLHAIIIGLQLLYALDHAYYFALILVHGLKINHTFEINHICEFGPVSLGLLRSDETG